MGRTLIYLAGGLALLAVAAAAGVALFLRPTAVETTEVVRTLPRVVPATTVVPLEPRRLRDVEVEDEGADLGKVHGVRVADPLWSVPASLEEIIVKSEVVARVRFESVEPAGVKPAFEYANHYSPEEYAGALKFTLSVLEYLKGSGATMLTAYAYGWTGDDNGFEAATEATARTMATTLLDKRDTRWDDREAIVLLRHTGTDGHYYLAPLGNYICEITCVTYTMASFSWRAWLPDAAAPGAARSERTPGPQRFLLAAPGAARGAAARARSPSGSSDDQVETIAIGDLRSLVDRLGADLVDGGGSALYEECLVRKYERLSHFRDATANNGGVHPRADYFAEIVSGRPAGTRAFETLLTPHLLEDVGPAPPAHAGTEIYTLGPDSDVLVGAWPMVIDLARPLPDGKYVVHLVGHDRIDSICDGISMAMKKRDVYNLTVTSPAGTLAESFFDPYADGAAVTGTTTVGTISWQPGQVEVALTQDATGHALDFIALDGTTTLSLIVADATEDAGTLSWSVPTQPWSAGDQLMLRIRRDDAPTPTPAPTPIPTATPTLAPTPIPTDRPVVLFLDSLDATVLESLEMAVGDVYWVSVKALNLESSDSYTIEVSRVNDEPVGGVGIALHYQVCAYHAQSIPVSPGGASFVRTMAVHLCTGTGGTVTAVLKQGETTLATGELEVSTPP